MYNFVIFASNWDLYKVSYNDIIVMENVRYVATPNNFTSPINSWLKTDLKYLLDLSLNSNAINESGFFYSSYVEKLKNDFLNDKLNNPIIIWKLIQFQMWYKKWMIDN